MEAPSCAARRTTGEHAAGACRAMPFHDAPPAIPPLAAMTVPERWR